VVLPRLKITAGALRLRAWTRQRLTQHPPEPSQSFRAPRSARINAHLEGFSRRNGALVQRDAFTPRRPRTDLGDRGVRSGAAVPDIMKGPIDSHTSRAATVRYLTIPGTYFHENRVGLSARLDTWTKAFEGIGLAAEVVQALIPLLAVRIRTPHDGIVEEASNSLLPCETGRWSEKVESVNYPDAGAPTYAHVLLRAADDLNHVTLLKSPVVAEAVGPSHPRTQSSGV